MKSEITHRCFYCLQVISRSVYFVLEILTTTTSKKKVQATKKAFRSRVQTQWKTASMHKDRNLITCQAEILAIHFAELLSLQIVHYYVYFIIMNSWLDDHWRLVKKLDNLLVEFLIFRKH